MGVQVCIGDLERGVCSSIGHLRPRIREPEGGSAPASGASLAFFVSFGELERVVCSSIGHLRPRIREPEGDSAPASVSEFGKRFHGCPGMRPGMRSLVKDSDEGETPPSARGVGFSNWPYALIT